MGPPLEAGRCHDSRFRCPRRSPGSTTANTTAGEPLEVIDLFSQQGTLDELGIGTIRDALADRMFPGTSTIQTRVRYFLFIPRIYQRLERRRTSPADIAAKARDQEIRLAQNLAETEADATGVSSGAKRRRFHK